MKKNTIEKNVELNVRQSLRQQKPICGDCEGFSCSVLVGTKLCKHQDILDVSKICTSYQPAVNGIKVDGDEDNSITSIMDLVRVADSLSDTKARALGVLLMSVSTTRSVGYSIGEKVYVRYRGQANRNYISNFMTAHIMFAKRGVIRLMSKDGKIAITLMDDATGTVYSESEFETIKERMFRNNRFADPEVSRNLKKSLRCVEEYALGLYDTKSTDRIPTIDSVFKTNKIRKSTRTGDIDMVDIVKAIEMGHRTNSIEVERNSKKRSKAIPNKDSSTGITVTSI